jgi:phospholipase/carboxylesterase
MGLQELQIGPVACQVATSPGNPGAVVVFMHGYTMDTQHLTPMACALGLPAVLYFPRGLHATHGGGRSWWPVDEQRRNAALARGPRDLWDEYPAGRDAARAALLAVARHAQARHPGLPLLLAGFSQGAMLACDTFLQEDLDVRALVLLSSSCIASDEWRPRLQRLRGLPALVAHGTGDPDLAFAAGERLRDLLLEGGANVTWLPFDGGHEIPFTVWRSVKRLVLQITLHRQLA